MPLRFTDRIVQANRDVNISRSNFYHVVETADVNYAVSGFQSNLVSGEPNTGENFKYVIDDPYDLHPSFGASQGSSGLFVLEGITLGTGDILKSSDYDERDFTGQTFSIHLDASNVGELISTPTGLKGTIIFNEADSDYYGFNGTTWNKILQGDDEYIKSISEGGGILTVVSGNGSSQNISLSTTSPGVEVGLSGGSQVLAGNIVFNGATGIDISRTVDGATSSFDFSVDDGFSFGVSGDFVAVVGGATPGVSPSLNQEMVILGGDNIYTSVQAYGPGGALCTISMNPSVEIGGSLTADTAIHTGSLFVTNDGHLGGLSLENKGITFPDGTYQETAGGGGGGFVGITATDDNASAQSVVSADDRITINTGTGLSKSVSGSVLTIDAEDAATSSKGIAQFDASDFDVSSGLVTLENTVVKGVSTGNLGQTINSVVLDDHFFSILGGNGITCSLVSGDDSSVLIRAYAADISTDRVWKFDSSGIGNPSGILGGRTALSVSTWPIAGQQIELYFDDEDDNTNSVKDFIEKIEVGDELTYYDTEEPTQDFINATARAYANGSPAWQLNSGVYTVYVTVNNSEGTATSSDRNKDPFALEVVRRGFSVSPEDQSSTTIKRTNASGQVLQPYEFIAENTFPSSNGEISIQTNSIPYEYVQIHKLNGYNTANDNRVYFSGFSNLTDNILTITAQPGQKGLSGGYAEYKLGPSSYNGTYYSFPILDSITGGDAFGTGDLVYLNLTKGHIDQYVKTFNGETGDVTNTVSDVATFSFLSSSAISTGDKLNAMYRIPYDATLTRIDLKKSATGGFEYNLRIAGPDFGDPLTGEQLVHGETMAAGAGVTGSVTSFSGISGVTAGDYLFLDIVDNGAGATALQMWVTYESR